MVIIFFFANFFTSSVRSVKPIEMRFQIQLLGSMRPRFCKWNHRTAHSYEYSSKFQNCNVYFVHCKMFSACGNLKQRWNRTYADKNSLVMRTSKQLFRADGGMLHIKDRRLKSLMIIRVGQKNTFVFINQFLQNELFLLKNVIMKPINDILRTK